MKKNPRIGIIILLSVGSILLCAGIIWFGAHLQFTQTAEVTNGTVIELIHKHKYGYSPKVTFLDTAGHSHAFTSLSSQSPAIAQPGESLPVLYDASNPSHAIISSFVSLWFGPLMLYIAGSINLLLGILFWYVIRKKQKHVQRAH